jgi:hypothetical protein
LVGSLWGIGALQAGGARAATADLPPLAVGDLKIYFKYHDFDRSVHRFSCEVDAGSARQEEASFGYSLDRETILSELDQRLEQEIKSKMGPLAEYAVISVAHTKMDEAAPRYSILWSYHLGLHWPSRLLPYRQEEVASREKQIRRDLAPVAERVYREYLYERGFDYERPVNAKSGQIIIAFKRLADRARPLLADCYDRFVREAGPGDQEDLIKYLLAYFQEMPFQLPPLEEDGLYTEGFWVPTKTLRLGGGDCDSKSAALCAMWQNPGPQIMLFVTKLTEEEQQSVPPEMRAERHVLIGIEAYPGFDQASVMIGLRRYVLCEAVGRVGPGAEKLYPGERLFASLPTSGFCMTDDCYGFDLRK